MILDVKNLKYGYSKDKILFNDVSFSLKKGEILTLLGPNGVGKSTLLNCLANLIKPLNGIVKLDNNDISKINHRDTAQLLGYVPQLQDPTFAYTVKEYVVMGRAPYLDTFSRPSQEDYDLVDSTLDKLDITRLSHQAFDKLSGGERQLVAFSRVIVQQPKIILLDEPTAHLDYGNQYHTIKMIKDLAKQGYTIILTTHMPEHALLLNDKVGILDYDGTFLFGDAKEIVTEKTLEKIYGCELRIINLPELDRTICTYAKELL